MSENFGYLVNIHYLFEKLLHTREISSSNKYLDNLDPTPFSNYSRCIGKIDEEKGNLFVEHLKNVFTPNVSNDIIELPPILLNNTIVKPLSLRFERSTVLLLI